MAYLETHGLGRDFPGVTALDKLDLSIELGRTHIDASIPINGVEAFARIARDAMGANVRMRGDEVILSSGSNARSSGK